MSKYTVLPALCLFAIAATNAQPSTSTEIGIRLYDNHGRVKPKRYSREYKMINIMNGAEMELGYNMNYDKKEKMYYFSIGAIYPPYGLKICHGNDTMFLLLPDSYLAFEKLVFQRESYCFLYPEYRKKSEQVKAGYYKPVYARIRNIDWDAARKRCDTLRGR